MAPGHDGASLQAANWRRLGETTGRGRQDRGHDRAVGRKAIYVRELVTDWRRRLGVGPPPPLASDPLAPCAGLDGRAWAAAEFGAASLGDARLGARLVTVAGIKGENPMASFPAAARGDRAQIKACYRFLDPPDPAAVTPAAILRPHRERTLRRMRGEPVVLCLQDGTDLNFATRPGCAGLGVIGRSQTGVGTLGLHLHSMLPVSPTGLPLGIVSARFDAPPGKDAPEPPDGRKTGRWLEGYRTCAELGGELGPGRVVCVADREADILELFEAQRERPDAELLVRARGRRRIAVKGGSPGSPRKRPTVSLLEALRAAPVRGRMLVAIDRLTPRPKSSRRQARPERHARSATLVLRSRTVELAPTARQHQGKPPMWLQGVLVEEERTPETAEPIQWLLLTTLPVDTLEACRTVVAYYARRWRIEDWHRILKSGCKVEDLANRSADRLERAATINLVIAWRLHLMTLIGRDHPNWPADVLFSEIEITVLKAYAAQQRLDPPDTINRAVGTIARIGGHMHRPRGPPPGPKVIWRGYVTLGGTCIGYTLAIEQREWERST